MALRKGTPQRYSQKRSAKALREDVPGRRPRKAVHESALGASGRRSAMALQEGATVKALREGAPGASGSRSALALQGGRYRKALRERLQRRNFRRFGTALRISAP